MLNNMQDLQSDDPYGAAEEPGGDTPAAEDALQPPADGAATDEEIDPAKALEESLKKAE
ncbi:hypothetical protein FQZ97_1016680 [compost metagenome]